MSSKALPNIIDVDFQSVGGAKQAAEGIEFSHDGQTYSLQLVNGQLTPVPVAPDHPALDHRPYQRAQQALTQAAAEEARVALGERYRVLTEIEAEYEHVPMGRMLGGIAKFRADVDYRRHRRQRQIDNLQSLAQVGQEYSRQVSAYLHETQQSQADAMRFGAAQRALEQEEFLDQTRFTNERARVEHVHDYDDARSERIAKAHHERQLVDVRTANAHQFRMAESATTGQVQVIEATGRVEVEKERLRLQIEEARQQRLDQEAAHKEEREDQRLRDERAHELVKRRQDLAKMIPYWQRAVADLEATAPEKFAQAAARAYMAFNDAFLEWSTVSSPEELIRMAPQIDELATAASARILEAMAHRNGSSNGTKDK